MSKNFENKMKELSNKTELTYDGGDDQRLFHSELINVFVPLMKKSEYEEMCKDLKHYSVKGDGFSIYGWNDVSSYEYWKEAGKDNFEANYIQITVSIEEIDLVNADIIKIYVKKAFDYFYKYDNTDEMRNYISRNRS